jgi:hypothetical protein
MSARNKPADHIAAVRMNGGRRHPRSPQPAPRLRSNHVATASTTRVATAPLANPATTRCSAARVRYAMAVTANTSKRAVARDVTVVLTIPPGLHCSQRQHAPDARPCMPFQCSHSDKTHDSDRQAAPPPQHPRLPESCSRMPPPTTRPSSRRTGVLSKSGWRIHRDRARRECRVCGGYADTPDDRSWARSGHRDLGPSFPKAVRSSEPPLGAARCVKANEQ